MQKLKNNPSYIPFLRKLVGDVLVHNKGVEEDPGSKKQETREESYVEFLGTTSPKYSRRSEGSGRKVSRKK